MTDNSHFTFSGDFEVYINEFDEIHYSKKVSDLDFLSFYVEEGKPNYFSLIRSLGDKLSDRHKFESASELVRHVKGLDRNIYRKFALGYKKDRKFQNGLGLLKNWDLTKKGCLSIFYEPDNDDWLKTVDAIIEQAEASTFYNKVSIATNDSSYYSQNSLIKECVQIINEDPRVAIDNFISNANTALNSKDFLYNENEILILDIDFDLNSEFSTPEDLTYLGYDFDQAEYVWKNLNKIVDFGPIIGFAIVNISMLNGFNFSRELANDSSIIMRNLDLYEIFDKLSYDNHLRLNYTGRNNFKIDSYFFKPLK